MPKISFDDVAAELRRVDEPDVLERVKTSLALRIALEMTRPPNWWGSGADAQLLLLIAYVEGIPVAWIPRKEIVTDLVRAADAAARLTLLEAREKEVLDDCMAALGQCVDPWLGGDSSLAKKAIEAYRNGHHEAGMALAVSLAEPLAKWASRSRSISFDTQEQRDEWKKTHDEVRRIAQSTKRVSEYVWADWRFSGVGFDETRTSFKEKVVMGPIPRFFVPFNVALGEKPPEWLARHVVAHLPVASQFSKINALLSLMLVASLLREQQFWCSQARDLEDFAEAEAAEAEA